MRAFFHRHETPLAWVYGLSLALSMLLFGAVGFWLYVVFAVLAIPAILGSFYMTLRGKPLGQDGWIMLVALSLFLVFGGHYFIHL